MSCKMFDQFQFQKSLSLSYITAVCVQLVAGYILKTHLNSIIVIKRRQICIHLLKTWLLKYVYLLLMCYVIVNKNWYIEITALLGRSNAFLHKLSEAPNCSQFSRHDHVRYCTALSHEWQSRDHKKPQRRWSVLDLSDRSCKARGKIGYKKYIDAYIHYICS